jgi:hypothetical protein
MVDEDEFPSSMLLLPPPDTVAFRFGRFSGAASRTYQAKTIA